MFMKEIHPIRGEKSKVKKQWFYCCHCEIFNDE